jgi:hypothetical protein
VGVGDVLDPDVAGPVHDGCAHRDLPCASNGLELVESERGREVAEGVDLLLQRDDLPLGRADRVGTGDEAARRLLLVGDGQQCLGELGRVAPLLAVLRLPRLALGGVALGVVVDGGLG